MWKEGEVQAVQSFSHTLLWKHFTLSANITILRLNKSAVHLNANQSLTSLEILMQSDIYNKHN